MVRSLRFGFVLLAVLLAVGVVAAIASAGPAVTETVTGKDTDNFVDVAPTCEGGGPLKELGKLDVARESSCALHATSLVFSRQALSFPRSLCSAAPLKRQFGGCFWQPGEQYPLPTGSGPIRQCAVSCTTRRDATLRTQTCGVR